MGKPSVLGIDDASEVAYITAKASGSVKGVIGPDPAFDSNCRFEYVTDAQFLANGFNGAGNAACNEPVGEDPTPVTANLAELKPDTTYHLRLSISNADGKDTKEAASTFTTLPVAPPTVLSVNDASEVAYTQAQVSGSIERPAGPDPGAFDAHCTFEYVTADQFTASGFKNATPVTCDPEAATDVGLTEVKAQLTGLTVGTTYHVRIVASNAGGSDAKEATNTFTTLVPGAPTVSIFAPTDVTATTAHFSGEIDPGGTDPGQNVNWHFECTPACPGLNGTIETGSPEQVFADATGLKVNTTYEVSLVASNVGSQASAGPEEFTTVALAPIATTFPAFALSGGTKALVGGKVDAQNAPTTYWVQYGTDDSYGTSIPLSEDASAGSGEEPVFVTQEISGLKPLSTYHFRLVAKNATGITLGQDLTFTTAPASGLGSSIGQTQLPDNRAWEMVSPVDKNGSDILRVRAQASVSGDAMTYQSQGSFAGQPTAKAGLFSDYLSRRGANGWSTEGITPPGGRFSANKPGYHGFSDDLNRGYLLRFEPGGESLDPDLETNPSDVATVARSYLRDNTTGKYKFVAGMVGGSSDFSHSVLQSGEELTPSTPCQFFCVYEKVGDETRLVSILPDGTPTFGQYFAISKDGSRIYWTIPFGGDLYVRIDGESTTRIAGAGSFVVGVDAPTGERALIISPEALVSEDEDSAYDLYLWDETKPEGERYTLISKGDIPGVEADFGSVVGNGQDRLAAQSTERGYFTTNNQILAGQPDEPGQKIYYWEFDGDEVNLSYVSQGGSGTTSHNGRYLAFASTARMTAYDNGGKQEIYGYDGATRQLICVSCDPRGRPAKNVAAFNFIFYPFEESFELPHTLRNVSDNGQVFFQSYEPLVPRDSNGKMDVYEYADGVPHLISSGTGIRDSRFLDASASGDDVFFATVDKLVGWDVANDFDVYDARVDGGLPEPPPGVIGCDGDACQSVPAAPNDPTPSSTSFSGPGNLHKKKAKRAKKRHHKKQKQAKRRHAKHETQRHG